MAPLHNERRTLLLSLAAILISSQTAMLLAQNLGAALEVDHYTFWTKLVTEGGIQAAYSGAFPHTYAIYPPLTLYFYWIVGHIYQAVVDPMFDLPGALGNPTLVFLIKLPGMIFHLLSITLIYFWLQRRHGLRKAWLAGLVYGLQPAVLFDVAVWGQPDPVHSFFILLAVISLLEDRPLLAAGAYGLAAITKPQAWILGPLLLFYVWRRYGIRQTATGLIAGLVVIIPFSLPFLIFGTWRQLLGLPQQIARVAPWVSANAHNLWWLILGEHATAIPDFERNALGRSWFATAAVLVGLSVIFCVLRLKTNGDYGWRSLPAVLALQSFAFFFLMTKAHENHAFLVLPLLTLCLFDVRRIAFLYIPLSVTLLLNLLLHDPTLAPQINQTMLAGQIKSVQWWNAAANLLLIVGWIASLTHDKRILERKATDIPARC